MCTESTALALDRPEPQPAPFREQDLANPSRHARTQILVLVLDRDPRPGDRSSQQVLTPVLSISFGLLGAVSDSPDPVRRGSLRSPRGEGVVDKRVM